MAFSATTILEVQTGGDDTNNGGAFNPANANMATDLTTDANTANTSSPVVSSASYNFQARDVGHWVYIKSGTNWTPGWYQIASVASNKATLSASAGAAVRSVGSTPAGTNSVAGCATVGTPTNGTWSIDYSQTGAAGVAFTDLVAASTTTFTSAANPIGKNFVGNVVSVTAGTGWNVVRWEVSSVTGTTGTAANFSSGTTIATGGSTGGTGGLGGALISLGLAGGLQASGDSIFVKSGSYTVTTATINVTGGCYSSFNSIYIEGYNSLRGDLGTSPVLTASGISTFTLIATGNNALVANITCDAASLSAGKCFTGFFTNWYRCLAKNGTTGIDGGTQGRAHFCAATGCSSFGFSGLIQACFCEAYSNAASGFTTTGTIIKCLSYGNTGASSHGFNLSGSSVATGCVAYNNGASGFNAASVQGVTCVDCVAELNAAYGFKFDSASRSLLVNAATYNNTSGSILLTSATNTLNINPIPNTTGTFFVNAAAGNFAPNSTASQGALLHGISHVYRAGTTTDYSDSGVQHQDSGGGGLVNPIISASGGLIMRGLP